MKKNIFQTLVFVSIVVFCSCLEKNTETEYQKYFRMNKSSLGADIIDEELGIKFKPPIEWDLMPAELSRKIEFETKNPDEKNFIYQPIYLFFNDSTRSLLSIGKIEYLDTLMNSQVQLNFYRSLLNSKFKYNDLVVSNFKNASISFYEFKSEKGSIINYKIIFVNLKKNIIQLDCTITKKYFEDENKLLKACIGSVDLVNIL